MQSFPEFIGRTRTSIIRYTPELVRGMAATMDWDQDRQVQDIRLSPLWHWLGGGQYAASRDLGEDGHERLGNFLPPFQTSVRMWAAGSIEMPHELRADCSPVHLRATILGLSSKTGRTGPLEFVEILQEYVQEGRVCVRERQTLVYRSGSTGFRREPAPFAPRGRRVNTYNLTDSQIFRYSALTFNSHRIHLDRRYCEEYEGDPRLVVHGPLLATILARTASEVEGAAPREFAFRAYHPVREGETFHACTSLDGAQAQSFWIAGDDGTLRMSATGKW